MRMFPWSNLAVLSCLVCACVAAPDPADTEATSDEEYALGAAQSDLDESVDVARSAGAEVNLAINEAPCGDRTIAVVTDARSATYAFCASPGGDGGALVFELLPSPSMESLLDETPDPVALLERVVPPGQDVPAWVVESVQSGARAADHPFTVIAKPSTPVSTFVANACADPGAVYDEAWDSEFPDFYDEFVYFGGAGSSYTIRDCVREHTFWHEAYGTSQRTASGYTHTQDGACAGYARVYSCDGYTLLKGLVREGTTGEWDEFFSFWVPAGGLGKVKAYANAQHSCHPTRDKDDIRFRAESNPGAYHHFVATFIGRTDTVGNGLICNTDPV